MMFQGDKVADDAIFDIQRYPHVESEIVVVSRQLRELRGDHKDEVVISFLKDHCISTSLLADHKEVVRMIRSGSVNTENTEKLFGECKHNTRFLVGFEQYISSALR